MLSDGCSELHGNSYTGVEWEIDRSASCASYNIKMKHAPKVVRDTFPDTVRE